MINYQHIVHCTYFNFVCAGIKLDHPAYQSDTDSTHFSFAVYGVEPEDFANVIDDFVVAALSHELSDKTKFVELKAVNSYDTIRMQFDYGNVSITRGNLKVLFHGHVSILQGLPKAIRKAVVKRELKHEKECMARAKECEDFA